MRIFSKKDGTTLIQDLQTIKAEAKLFFDAMPVKLKAWMYEATIIIDALQKLDDALQEGEPADKAIDFILGQIKGDADEAIYEAVKKGLHDLVERMNDLADDIGEPFIYGDMKKDIATDVLIPISELSVLEADTVTQNAVYIYKS